jgi:PAS domain S-box-containing protein
MLATLKCAILRYCPVKRELRMSDPDAEPTATDNSIIQAITDYAIYRLDTAGIVTRWNPGAERVKGYRASEIIGRHFSLFFTPEDQANGRPHRLLAAARANGGTEDEGWRVRQDGTRFWASIVIDPMLDQNGQIVGFAKVTRDLTERMVAQDALRQIERRFRLLIESVTDYALYTLDPEGIVTSWNPGAERAKGYKQEEILGRNYSVFYTPEDQATGKPALGLLTAQADGRFEEEGWRVRKDGARFWASVVIDPMWDESGQLAGFAKITRDITEKRALAEAKEQLHQSQKMEAIGQLTGGVAHDFNNLLAVIIGSVELIATLSDDARVRYLIETAQRAAERGAKLTYQLLSFSRQQFLRPKTSNINELTKEFDVLLRQAGGEATDLQFNLGAALWLADIDQAQFQSALLNLVLNARDAMPSGGILTISTNNTIIDHLAAAELTEITPGPYIAVTLDDTGTGMKPEVMARAIEPFYTTKAIGRGSGLGLSQVYGFVRQSNGQMTLKNRKEGGTSVCIYLPRSIKSTSEDAETASHAATNGRGTILVVEDDPDVLEIATIAIRSLGYQVHAARDASAALTILQSDVWVDLLFTDVVMPPGKNGVELARDACLLRPSLRVLLASGYPRDSFRYPHVDVESMAFISKPYTLPALSERLAALGRGGTSLTETPFVQMPT